MSSSGGRILFRHVLGICNQQVTSAFMKQPAFAPIVHAANFANDVKLAPEITFAQFESLRRAGSATLVDVRESAELEAKGAIPGTTNVPMSDFEGSFAHPDDKFTARFGIEKPEKSDAVVVFCAIGKRSANARNILMGKYGYDNVANYKGSFTEWNEMNSGDGKN